MNETRHSTICPEYAWSINSTGYLNWIINYPGKTMPTNVYAPLNNIMQVVLTFNGFYVTTYKNGELVSIIPAPRVNNSNLNELIIEQGMHQALQTPSLMAARGTYKFTMQLFLHSKLGICIAKACTAPQ
ncbi:MAG: hypothetical protein ACP5T4_01760 [Candidatus Micrarchaeia archaeon]